MLGNTKDIQDAFARYRRTEEPTSVDASIAAASEAPPVVIQARLNYTSVGVCPYCAKPMGRVNCCDQEVFLCESDRFVSPLPNAELPEVPQ